jgi:hypothetical protein
MWQVTGKPVDAGLFRPFRPAEVLYEFDGPRTFTHLDPDGELFFAHWCDEDRDATRFLVVPFSDQLVTKIKDGDLTLRDALNQPRLWVVDVTHAGEPRNAWITRLDDVPDDVLPQRGTMLLPALEPLLSLRAVGEDIQEGRVPASVIKNLIDGVQKAVKMLAEYVLGQPAQAGRPPALIKRLFDLPTQRLAFNSFEISFRSPIASSPTLMPVEDEAEARQEQEALRQIGALFQTGLQWLQSPPGANTADVGRDSHERRLILQAVKHLTPSPQGPVREVEVRGTLVKSLARPSKLTRDSRRQINSAIAQLPAVDETVVREVGRIGEVDRDRLTFELRKIESGETIRKFHFEEDLLEDVLQAFQDEYPVTAAGIAYSGGGYADALAVIKARV